jgi:hypothetical protein
MERRPLQIETGPVGVLFHYGQIGHLVKGVEAEVEAEPVG